MITPAIARTLHTYTNTLKILCEAFRVESNGRDAECKSSSSRKA